MAMPGGGSGAAQYGVREDTMSSRTGQPSVRLRVRWRTLVWLATGAIALWLGGFGWFVAALPSSDQPLEPVRPTDAIVVLTGGERRLPEGMRLLAAGKAKQLLVTGVNERVGLDQVLSLADDAPPELSCCITLGYRALSTAGNAEEASHWMEENGFRTLRLVTAYYHMARSLLEFRERMPDVTIIAHPVFPDPAGAGEAGGLRRTLMVLFVEYNKLLVAYARIGLGLSGLFGSGAIVAAS
jgi:uncharacterized SAM-binding protein YcdF (DUF218 family)